jgi:hypothetical protein
LEKISGYFIERKIRTENFRKLLFSKQQKKAKPAMKAGGYAKTEQHFGEVL